jgi:Alkylmercury lyase
MPWQDIPLHEPLAKRLSQVLGLKDTPRTLGELSSWRNDSCCTVTPADLLSPSPTNHRVYFDDEMLYTNCVLDALILPSLRGRTAEVVSRDPESCQEVRLRISREGLEPGENAPVQAVVSLGVLADETRPLHEAFCPFVNLFVSRAGYDRWAGSQTGAITVPIPLNAAVALAWSWGVGMAAGPGRAGVLAVDEDEAWDETQR